MDGSFVKNERTPQNMISSFLVVLILSAPSNTQQRDAIRQTWLNAPRESYDVVHYFSLGAGDLESDEYMTLQSEQNRFHDLLLIPSVNDSYRTLTKKLQQSFIWLVQNADFKFLLKVDDDSFAQLGEIMKELHSVKDKKKLYWGFFSGHAQVKQYGLWQEKEWNLCDHYLPYAVGGGYVLSHDLVSFIEKNKEYLKLYRSEDVSVGAWLAALSINRIHDPRFDTEYKSRGCFNSYLITHKQSIEEMKEKHWLLKEKGRLCREQTRSRYSYIYNWNVLPSHCCVRNDSSVP